MIHLDRSQSHHNSKHGMDKAGFILGIWVLFWVKIFVGGSIEILGVIGDDNDVWFELRLVQIFRISSVASSLSCYLISLYI